MRTARDVIDWVEWTEWLMDTRQRMSLSAQRGSVVAGVRDVESGVAGEWEVDVEDAHTTACDVEGHSFEVIQEWGRESPAAVLCTVCGAAWQIEGERVPVRSLEEAWLAVCEIKGRDQPVLDPATAERLGREWVERLAARHDLTDTDMSYAISVNNDIAARSIKSLMLMRAEGMVAAYEVLTAVHASGFINGLALGLERQPMPKKKGT